MKLLGRVLRQARESNRMSLEDVARRLGYRNLARGVRKLMAVEATGVIPDEKLVHLADVLCLDWATLEEVVHCLRREAQSPS